MSRTFLAADLFCGAGGTSTGAARAIKRMGGRLELVAVNHWDLAIKTHTRNHPRARHYCIELDTADPEQIVSEGYLDLLMASPECKDHSRARGGKPIRDQRRADAWLVNRWLTKLDVAALLIENVPEFVDWGPVCKLPRHHEGEHREGGGVVGGTPCNTRIRGRKGVYFQKWVESLWGLGYAVEWRFLNCADYGDATTRKRFFLIARKDGAPIRWPEASHSRTGSGDMFGGTRKWRAAREIIDWSQPGRSLFDRPKPLSLKTRLRIARGLQKYGGELAGDFIDLLDLPAAERALFAVEPIGTAPEPFIVNQRDSWDGRVSTPGRPRWIEEPTFAVTADAGMGLVEPGAEPFHFGNRENGVPRSPEEPIATVTGAHGGGIAAVQPVPLILPQGGGADARPVDEPLATIATGGAIAKIDPHLSSYYGNGQATPVTQPVPTLTGHDRHALVLPLADALTVPYGPKAEARSIEQPLHAVTGSDRHGLAETSAVPFVIGRSSTPTARGVEEPLPTATGSGAGYLVDSHAEPFLVSRQGHNDPSGRTRPVGEPVPTITGSDAGTPYVVEPDAFLLPRQGHSDPSGRVRSIEDPLATVVASETSKPYLYAPFLTPNFGEDNRGQGQPPRVHGIGEPVPAVTSRGAGNLVSPVIVPTDRAVDPRRLRVIRGRVYLLDIRFRMLKNRELARAMSFDDDGEYDFVGKQAEITEQIGNAVPCRTAEALVTAILVASTAATEASA